MNVLAVLPARIGSTRLPQKPLAQLRGRPLIEWVWRAVCAASRPGRVVVATDSEAVEAACRSFGAVVMRTAAHHSSGSDRVAEVARRLPEFDAVVNVQGDEPLLDPQALDAAVTALEADPHAAATTLAHEENDAAAAGRPEVVRVECDPEWYATAFARGGPQVPPGPFLRHVGLYAFRRPALLAFTEWPPTVAERAASLEQLRLLEHGLKMRVVVTSFRSHAVDTPADLAYLETNWDHLVPRPKTTASPSSYDSERPQ